MHQENLNKKSILGTISKNRHIVACFACILFTTAISSFLYSYTKDLLRSRLDERLIAIVSTSSLLFSGGEIEKLSNLGVEAAKTPEYRKVVLTLQSIRAANKDIRYAYIMAPTENENEVKYVADADAISITPVIDFNEDGEINDEDVSKPGDTYDASEAPALQSEAFIAPTVDEEVTIDTWGSFLSAYAPIKSHGKAVATVVIDVEVTDLLRLISATFLPFLIFVFFLLLVIVSLTMYIGTIWREQVQVLVELDRQKDELLGLVSHQLATPVSGLRWNMEMILDGDLGELTPQQKEEFTTMQGVVGNLSDLVSMILDVSRIQLGKMKVDKGDVDLPQFYKEMTDVLIPRAKDKKQTFTLHFDERLHQGYIDKRLSHMTIENLMSNAIKYTPEGGAITVDVTLQHDGMMRCVVSDNGMGIPKKDQDKIFGKLYRASNVATVDGNGFGLFVAKGAIEAQGGKIWFESQEGKGTKFFVVLPIAKQNKPEGGSMAK